MPKKYYRQWKFWLKFLLFLVVLGILVFFAEHLGPKIPLVEAWVKKQGPMAPFIFSLLMTLLLMLSFPTDILCFAAGILFGLFLGYFLAVVACLVSGSIMFFIARHLAGERIERWLNHYPKFRKLNRLLDLQGWKILFVLRMAPIPFATLSYSLGVTRVGFKKYFFSIFGTMGTVFLAVYYGNVAKHVTKLAGKAEAFDPLKDGIRIAGLVITIGLLWWITRYSKKVLAEAESQLPKEGSLNGRKSP